MFGNALEKLKVVEELCTSYLSLIKPIHKCMQDNLYALVGCAGESEDTNDSGGGGDGKITVNSKDANAAPVDRIQYEPVMNLGSFSCCSTFDIL